ncbi:APC family permease [Rothia sp. ZJ932]|uniref:APC family permease n=1 Tax=Rothia sp. ZJ932 TaxID=2810516 RepID=UPI001F082374|nr:APC family permease [Rothia sp. ZJ932]
MSATAPHSQPHDKGLASDRLGLASSTVVGLASTAPLYSLAATIGFVVMAVGVQAPIALIIAFVIMLLTAFAYKEFNTAVPDAGTSFTWVTKAFGPVWGWLSGWGVLVAGVIIMANQIEIAARYLWLMLGDGSLADNKHLVTGTGVLLIAFTTWISHRHVEAGAYTQWGLIIIQYLAIGILLVGIVSAFISGSLTPALDFSWSWFNPFAADFNGLLQAVLIAIFIYWGWDTSLSLSEETKNPHKTPGQAAILSSSLLVLTYVAVTVIIMMYAGVGDTGIGLANEEIVDDVFFAFKDATLGSLGWVLVLAVAVSALATCQTTILPTARSVFAMGVYKALPPNFAKTHPVFRTPEPATMIMGIVSAVFYAGMSYISTNMLADTVEATSLAVGFYYCVTCFACVRYFKGDIFTSTRNIINRLVLPLVGGVLMLFVLVFSMINMVNPEYGMTQAFGVSGVFLTAVVAFGIGGIVMVFCSRQESMRPFFRGESLNMSTGVKVPETEDLPLDPKI